MKLYKYKSLPHKKELTAEEKEQLEYCKDISPLIYGSTRNIK